MFEKIKDIIRSGKRLEPLVLQEDVWRAVFDKLTAIGGGEHVLPSENLEAVFLVAGDNEKNILTSAFGENRLENYLRGKLREERCRQADRLKVHFDLITRRPRDWDEGREFAISFGPAGDLAKTPSVTIRVLSGKASKTRFKFERQAINLGRGRDVTDKYGTILRRNDVDFADTTEEPNSSVSKLHARIEYSEADRAFYLTDSGFEYGLVTNGTRLIRDGNLVAVVKTDQRVRLENGDEIHLGRAGVSFEV